MKITHYLYNTFIIESGDKKIAIDPGCLFFYFFRATTLIPRSEWESITHIFVTHGDPDHYWHADRVAEVSNAPIICNRTMVKDVDGQTLMLGPRDRGVAFTMPVEKFYTVADDETIEVDGMSITGIKITHGELVLKVGPLSKTVEPGPTERIGWGSIGFNIQLGGKTVVNLGDTLLHTSEWESIHSPDVLMIPIGGKVAHNTMDEEEALQAVRMLRPKLVIPCHYNMPALFTRKYCPADDQAFKAEVEKTGADCALLESGESISL